MSGGFDRRRLGKVGSTPHSTAVRVEPAEAIVNFSPGMRLNFSCPSYTRVGEVTVEDVDRVRAELRFTCYLAAAVPAVAEGDEILEYVQPCTRCRCLECEAMLRPSDSVGNDTKAASEYQSTGEVIPQDQRPSEAPPKDYSYSPSPLYGAGPSAPRTPEPLPCGDPDDHAKYPSLVRGRFTCGCRMEVTQRTGHPVIDELDDVIHQAECLVKEYVGAQDGLSTVRIGCLGLELLRAALERFTIGRELSKPASFERAVDAWLDGQPRPTQAVVPCVSSHSGMCIATAPCATECKYRPRSAQAVAEPAPECVCDPYKAAPCQCWIAGAAQQVAEIEAFNAEMGWRVGRKLGRTLYLNGDCVGMVDTPEHASLIVEALKAYGACPTKPVVEVADWLEEHAELSPFSSYASRMRALAIRLRAAPTVIRAVQDALDMAGHPTASADIEIGIAARVCALRDERDEARRCSDYPRLAAQAVVDGARKIPGNEWYPDGITHIETRLIEALERELVARSETARRDETMNTKERG